MKKFVCWGATGQAKVLQEFLSHDGYDLLALFDNNPNVISPFPNIPVYCGMAKFQEWYSQCKGQDIYFAVAIGGDKGKDRFGIQQQLEQAGLVPTTLIHPTAFVAKTATLLQGCQILAHSSICVDVILGEACIINTSATIDHECVLGRGVHVAPGATLAGCVTVGDFSTIGTGASILPRIHIGNNVVIGAGAVVTKDLPDGVIARGVPAKVVRQNGYIGIATKNNDIS